MIFGEFAFAKAGNTEVIVCTRNTLYSDLDCKMLASRQKCIGVTKVSEWEQKLG